MSGSISKNITTTGSPYTKTCSDQSLPLGGSHQLPVAGRRHSSYRLGIMHVLVVADDELISYRCSASFEWSISDK
jgi:hypothetical protein